MQALAPTTTAPASALDDDAPATTVEVVIEIPRWSFLKRGTTGHIDFISPLPCPVNYGSVPDRIGGEGDLLDAVVLGPRLPRGSRLRVTVHGAIGLAERGLYDDKLICSPTRVSPAVRARLVRFFRTYIAAKRLLNGIRGRGTDGHCTGWGDAAPALARARPRDSAWTGPPVSF